MIQKYAQKIQQQQLLKYLIAGGTAFAVDYFGFILLFYALGLPIIASNTLSFLAGFFTSFFFNRGWTFKADKKYKWAAHHQLAAYLLLSLANLLASNLIVYALHLIMPAVIGKFIAAGMIACWNFIIFRAVIFKVDTKD